MVQGSQDEVLLADNDSQNSQNESDQSHSGLAEEKVVAESDLLQQNAPTEIVIEQTESLQERENTSETTAVEMADTSSHDPAQHVVEQAVVSHKEVTVIN